MTELITSLESTATNIAADIVTVAGVALAVLGAMYGIRLLIRAFKIVK